MTTAAPLQASPESAFQEALQVHRQGDVVRASQDYRQILVAFPGHLPTLQMLGITELQQGRPLEAAGFLRTVVSHQPGNADARSYLGSAQELLGYLDDAQTAYLGVLAANPAHVPTLVAFSNLLLFLRRPQEALDHASRAVSIQPSSPLAWANRVVAFLDLGRPDEALAFATQATTTLPSHPSVWLAHGRSLQSQSRWGEALESLENALRLYGGLTEAWLYRGHVLRALEKTTDSHLSYAQALSSAINQYPAGATAQSSAYQLLTEIAAVHDTVLNVQPANAVAWYNQGNAMLALGRAQDAVTSFERSLAINPQQANAWNNKGNGQLGLGDAQGALLSYQKALDIAPDQIPFLQNLANTLLQLNRPVEAASVLDQVLAQAPAMEAALLTKASALLILRRLDEAIAAYDRVLQINPVNAAAWSNRGQSQLLLKRHRAAVQDLSQALALAPNLTEALNNRGIAWTELGMQDKAVEDFDRAIAIDSSHSEFWSNRGNALWLSGQHSEAIESYERSLTLDPNAPQALRILMHLFQTSATWDRLASIWGKELERTREHRSTGAPLPLLAHPHVNSADLLLAGKAYWANWVLPGPNTSPYPRQSLAASKSRLRIAYVSGDFRDHALSRLTAELFAAHARNRFEVIGISFSPDTAHPLRQRVESGFDRFVDVRDKSDPEVAELMRELQIDIAVDLTGYTEHHRFGIFARRCAPIQVNYLGYPGTSGAPFIDYIIGDRWVTPLESADDFSEKLVLMPESFQANDDQRQIAADTPSRASLGLPESGFVFCCLNNTYKITPMMFDIWMRVLSQVPGSVLWLLGESETVRSNLRHEAQARGVAPDRLVFAQRVPYEQYLAQYRQADLFLDTLPFNAGTTASDALWAGLPVLTQWGQTFAGRMAASLLDAVGLPELITRSDQEYEQLALKLATDPLLLKGCKQRLATNTPTAPLFNTQRFTRHLEAAFEAMWLRYSQGLPPQHIRVSPDNPERTVAT